MSVAHLNPAIYGAVPLSQYRSRSVIDWLDIGITTSNPTNFPTVQDTLMRILDMWVPPYVEPIDEGAGGAATRFRIRLHDVRYFEELADTLSRLAARIPFAKPPCVLAIEVAVDFYSRNQERSELLAMQARLVRQTSTSGKNPRQFVQYQEGGRETRSLRRDGEISRPGETFYAGNRDEDSIAWCIYLKETDNNKMPIRDVSMHRTRSEVTLRGAALAGVGITTLDSMGAARFEKMAKHFRCRTVVIPEPHTSPVPTVLSIVADRKRKVLLDAAKNGQHALAGSNRRKSHPATRADQQLNKLFRDKLRRLSDRFDARKDAD